MAVKSSKLHSSVFDSVLVPTSAYYPYAQHLSINPNTLAAYGSWAAYSDLSPSMLQQQQHLTSHTSLQQQPHTSHTSPSTASADEVVALQMQHLRFPTPPITPPFNSAYNTYKLTAAAATASATVATSCTTSADKEVRTQSVIMKIGQDKLVGNSSNSRMPPTPEHVDDVAVDIIGLDDAAVDSGAELLRHETRMTSATSSASSSPKRSEYTCEWIECGRDHNTLEALAAHVTKIHAVASPSDGLYYCRWYGCARMRGFSARYKMLVHARTHTKEKPHQCHLCTKSFSRAENLKIHIRSHSGEKPYLCTYEGCNKAYSNSSDRFKHTRTHAMDKPYMCKVPGCQKRYTDPSSLRKHVKTFKHATQLIATAAITPCKNGIFGDPVEGTETAQRAPLHAQNPSVVAATHAEGVNGNHHLHAGAADTYAQGYADATTTTIPVCQLCVPPPPPPHYYLTAMEEDLCSSIKAAQLDYYYAAASQSPARSSTASSSWSSNVNSEGSAGLAMELEAPLDLRVNRR